MYVCACKHGDSEREGDIETKQRTSAFKQKSIYAYVYAYRVNASYLHPCTYLHATLSTGKMPDSRSYMCVCTNMCIGTHVHAYLLIHIPPKYEQEMHTHQDRNKRNLEASLYSHEPVDMCTNTSTCRSSAFMGLSHNHIGLCVYTYMCIYIYTHIYPFFRLCEHVCLYAHIRMCFSNFCTSVAEEVHLNISAPY